MTVSSTPSRDMALATTRTYDGAIVPFNILETTNRDLFAAFACFFHPDSIETLHRAFQEWTQREHIVFAPSGQCAIAQILSVLPQEEVVMPAWICHDVKVAAQVAGKRIIYVDLNKNGINATSTEYAAAAKPGRILLAAHLFGVPTDIEAICDLARNRDCVTIEDAVPAFGGRQNGRLLGTFADFGVFSFQQSKRISGIRGAAIVVNNERLVEPAKLAATRVTATRRTLPLLGLAQGLAQNFGTAPWVYRNVTLKLLPLRPRLEQLLSGHSRRSRPDGPATVTSTETKAKPAPRTQYYTREMHPYQAELVLRMLNRIDRIGEKIAQLASIYSDMFRDTSVATFLPPGCDKGGLMRFPIAFPEKGREEILRLASERGLYLKVLWSRPLPPESEWARFPNACWVARNLVLLPLYTALDPGSAAAIARSVVEIERAVRPLQRTVLSRAAV